MKVIRVISYEGNGDAVGFELSKSLLNKNQSAVIGLGGLKIGGVVIRLLSEEVNGVYSKIDTEADPVPPCIYPGWRNEIRRN